MPRLFARRTMLLPTLWGWLLIALVCAVLLVAGARVLVPWLSPTEPEPGATLLVVEGWLAERELDIAADYARAHGYRRIVASGGPINTGFAQHRNYAERAAEHLRARLGEALPVLAVPAPPTAQDRSFASAVWVRDALAREGGAAVDALNVYSLGPHARRTRMVYRLAFGPAVRVGIVAGVPSERDPVQWWRSSEAAKDVLMEAMSLAWTVCCFWPPPRGSHEERWALPPASAVKR